MNRERLAKVLDVIRENPDHFDMDYWWRSWNADDDFDDFDGCCVTAEFKALDLLTCGTTMCVAGWACYLWPAEATNGEEIANAAADILGLEPPDADALFSASKVQAFAMLEAWANDDDIRTER